MKEFIKINEHRYIYLDSITEPEDNSLCLILTEATSEGPEEDIHIGDSIISGSRAIESVSGCARYKLLFEDYISYNVTNESYAQDAEQDKYSGKLARTYEYSPYLQYIEASTFATQEYPGPFIHYGFCCLNHCIDVVSVNEPTVTTSVLA
ncbi:MAG TPA: hypothetical protein EYP18_01330 [Desulfobacterales bacterium]|nr:hypothetical protein [Desulfobacterales bacterium]